MNLLVPGEFLLLLASFLSCVTLRTNLIVSCLFFKKKKLFQVFVLRVKDRIFLEHIGNLFLSK